MREIATVVVAVIGLSLGLQVFDGLSFPNSLIVSLLIVNLALILLVLQKRASSENTPS